MMIIRHASASLSLGPLTVFRFKRLRRFPGRIRVKPELRQVDSLAVGLGDFKLNHPSHGLCSVWHWDGPVMVVTVPAGLRLGRPGSEFRVSGPHLES